MARLLLCTQSRKHWFTDAASLESPSGSNMHSQNGWAVSNFYGS